jgi:hypothetical protein
MTDSPRARLDVVVEVVIVAMSSEHADTVVGTLSALLG